MSKVLLLLTVLLFCVSIPLVSSQTICDIVNCIHGVCIVGRQRNEFRCECDLGYTGSFCERLCTPSDVGCTVVTPPPLCTQETCSNGECSSSGQCMCYPGWTGSNCEVDINHCESSDGSFSFFGPCDDIGSVLCTDGNDTYQCDCVIGFTGKNCETPINECETTPNPCSGNGMCIDGPFASYSCVCHAGFTGSTCDTAIVSPCDSSPCLNQGICQELPDKQFMCNCLTGFYGRLCEVRAPRISCNSMPCANGGTCTEVPGGNFTCVCPDGYFDSTCSTQNCTQALCQNGGTCVQNMSMPICQCTPLFGGEHCDINLCENTTCSNGGVCIISSGNPRPSCECKNGFTGPSCETPLCTSTCPNEPTTVSANGSCVCNNTDRLNTTNPPPNINCTHRGQVCQISPSENITCLNGGYYNATSPSLIPQCVCPDQFYGQTCEFDTCDKFRCNSGESCQSINGTCACGDGGSCSNSMSGSCDSFICMNGGTCRATNNSVFCDCRENFYGPLCQNVVCSESSCDSGCSCVVAVNSTVKYPLCQCIPTTEALSPPTNSIHPVLLAFLVLLAVAACLVLFGAFVIIIFFCGGCKRRRKQFKGNGVTIHAEYHQNSAYITEETISIDINHGSLANEDVLETTMDDKEDNLDLENEIGMIRVNTTAADQGVTSSQEDMGYMTIEFPSDSDGTISIEIKNSSPNLTQRSPDLTQRQPDLTQRSPDLTQRSPDLTQRSPDLTQRAPDLTQRSPDLTQRSPDSNQSSLELRISPIQSPELSQEPSDLTMTSPDLRLSLPNLSHSESIHLMYTNIDTDGLEGSIEPDLDSIFHHNEPQQLDEHTLNISDTSSDQPEVMVNFHFSILDGIQLNDVITRENKVVNDSARNITGQK